MNRYVEDFDGVESVRSAFNIEESDLRDDEVLFASYTNESYSGSALVIFERDGKLFEVNGGHCSCYGLEDQWSPEETTLEAIMMRPFTFEPGFKKGVLQLLAARQVMPTIGGSV